MWRGRFCNSRQSAPTVSSISALLSREILLTIAMCLSISSAYGQAKSAIQGVVINTLYILFSTNVQ